MKKSPRQKAIWLWAAFVAALVGLSLVSVGCGGNGPTAPSSPTPTPAPPPATCQEPGATNIGGPLPCVFPAVSSVTVEVNSLAPKPGGTLDSLKKEEVSARVEYTVSAADRDTAEKAGETILVAFCLSVDGKNPLTSACFYQSASGASGTTFHHTHVYPTAWVDKTDFVLAILVARSGEGQTEKERTIQKDVVPATYFWVNPS